jgi:hypothetical protein
MGFNGALPTARIMAIKYDSKILNTQMIGMPQFVTSLLQSL